MKLPLWLMILIPSYILLCLLVSVCQYRKFRKFWPYYSKPVPTKGDSDEEALLRDPHTIYDEYKRYDNDHFSFVRLFLGTLFLVLLRTILFPMCVITMSLTLRLSYCCRTPSTRIRKVTGCRRFFTVCIVKFFMFLIHLSLGIIPFHTYKYDERTISIYRKYLGEDFDMSSDRPYSIVISNHVGWVESFYYILKLVPGIITKTEISNIPVVGYVMRSIDSLFINRKNKENRDEVVYIRF